MAVEDELAGLACKECALAPRCQNPAASCASF